MFKVIDGFYNFILKVGSRKTSCPTLLSCQDNIQSSNIIKISRDDSKNTTTDSRRLYDVFSPIYQQLLNITERYLVKYGETMFCILFSVFVGVMFCQSGWRVGEDTRNSSAGSRQKQWADF